MKKLNQLSKELEATLLEFNDILLDMMDYKINPPISAVTAIASVLVMKNCALSTIARNEFNNDIDAAYKADKTINFVNALDELLSEYLDIKSIKSLSE